MRRWTRTTPGLSRLGVVVLGLWASVAHAVCTAPDHAERVQLKTVNDGDTLTLSDGRRVRLLGINSPELRPRQALGDAARAALQAYLGDSRELLLEPGQQARDRYGRVLAHVYRGVGEPAAEDVLLRAGLAWQVTIPPNLSRLDCLSDAETEARQQQRGVWAEPDYAPLAAADARPADAGFRRLQGRVVTVTQSRYSWWLELDGPVVVKLDKADLHHFDPALAGQASPRQWQGRTLALRGWLVDRSKSAAVQRQQHAPLLIRLRHPAMLESVD